MRLVSLLLPLFTLFPVGPAAGPSSAAVVAPPTGSLSDNQIIGSDALGYDLQYRVYLPAGYDDLSDLPVIFATDGQWYISRGDMPVVMDDLIDNGEIAPVMAVFIDNRDPHRLNVNRRNQQFFCNRDYIRFVTDELVPHIDRRYRTDASPAARVMLGLSFGGLNSACFGLHASDTFGGVAMQSPATHPVPNLHSDFERSPRQPVRIFLSTGTDRDNEAMTRRFRDVLRAKEYEMSYVEVPHGHTWQNWGPLLDDVLEYFFGVETPD